MGDSEGGGDGVECGCWLDRLETHSVVVVVEGRVECRCTGAYGGSSGPKLPVSA